MNPLTVWERPIAFSRLECPRPGICTLPGVAGGSWGYPGLIRCPDHPVVDAKPRFRSNEARNSKNQDMHGDVFGNADINGGMSLGNP